MSGITEVILVIGLLDANATTLLTSCPIESNLIISNETESTRLSISISISSFFFSLNRDPSIDSPTIWEAVVL